jgi:hypothetical protein
MDGSMTTAELVTALVSRGVELRAKGDKVCFRPADRLTEDDIDQIRRHKWALLGLLRAEGRHYVNPAADPRPRDVCDRCGGKNHHEAPIHGGQSLRRDCGHCHRFLGWPRWYGQDVPGSDCDTEARHED